MYVRRQFIARFVMLAALILSCAAHAASPPLVMSVDSKGKKQIQTDGKKGTERGMIFDVRIQNPLTNEVKCTLDWYFVASLVEGFGYFVSDQGSEAITLTPRGVATTTKQSAILRKAKAEDPGVKTAKKFVDAAAETKGFIVRLRVGEEVIAVYGEPPFIKRKADDPETFQDLLSTIPKLPPPPPVIKKR